MQSQSADSKTVVIIGAGVTGLAALKSCLEAGLSAVCLERSDGVGGLWNYQEKVQDGRSSVMRSTIINTCKEMTCYSDFPMPEHYANLAHHSKMLEYIQQYAKHFDLMQHIRFETEVMKVKQCKDSKDGGWEVTSRNLKVGDVCVEQFDKVMVCTGHHADRKMPHYEGQKEFKGQIIHSQDYRDHRGYEDKRVVVVGIGNSAVDIAVELGKNSKQVYLSTRRGSWITKRISNEGYPTDLLFSRINSYISRVLPKFWQNYRKRKSCLAEFDHELYGLKPAHEFYQQAPTLSDDLQVGICSGAIIVKPSITRLTEHGVVFSDGSQVEHIDTIICATGYVFGFPFIDHPGLEVVDNQLNLYKHVFSPELDHPGSLAVIGCIQPSGAFIPVAELQARWAVCVFKGDNELPSSSDMWKDIKSKHEENSKRYIASTRHTIQADFVGYQIELSEFCGCKPNLLRLAIADPKLAYHVLFGPFCPYQNRLVGPGAWPGARQAVLTMMDRVRYPLKNGHGTTSTPTSLSYSATIWHYLKNYFSVV